jgi:hypothetical protein
MKKRPTFVPDLSRISLDEFKTPNLKAGDGDMRTVCDYLPMQYVTPFDRQCVN